MTDLRFSLLFALFIVHGSVSDQSDSCTEKKIDDCVHNNINTNGCVFHDRVKTCIQAFLSSCHFAVRNIAMREIAINTFQKNQCPGLPDGHCYSDAIGGCLDDIRLPDGLAQGHTGNIHGSCDILRIRGGQAKQCLENLGPQCTGVLAQDAIQSTVRVLNNETAICGL